MVFHAEGQQVKDQRLHLCRLVVVCGGGDGHGVWCCCCSASVPLVMVGVTNGCGLVMMMMMMMMISHSPTLIYPSFLTHPHSHPSSPTHQPCTTTFPPTLPNAINPPNSPNNNPTTTTHPPTLAWLVMGGVGKEGGGEDVHAVRVEVVQEVCLLILLSRW